MFVTSILTHEIYKFNVKLPPFEFEELSSYINKFQEENQIFCKLSNYTSGFAVFYCKGENNGAKLMNNFYLSKGVDESNISFRLKVIPFECYKFVANFHSKDSAEEFLSFLEDCTNTLYIGNVGRIRNSIIYYCIDSELGHTLAKKFEDSYIAKYLEKISEPPQEIHPIDEEQKVYDLQITEVEEPESSTINKIFSIFKGNTS